MDKESVVNMWKPRTDWFWGYAMPHAIQDLSFMKSFHNSVHTSNSPGYLCHIGAEPTTNCNSNETYVILFQIYPCITY